MATKIPECLICDEGILRISVSDGKRLLVLSEVQISKIRKQKWTLALETNPIKKIRKVEIASVEDLGDVYQKIREYEIILK